jgi:hypothetical protein
VRISETERKAIVAVVAAGRKHGFGNIISHLQAAWTDVLVNEHGMLEADARQSSGGGYPIAMHRDLMERGEWDETGTRYRRKE